MSLLYYFHCNKTDFKPKSLRGKNTQPTRQSQLTTNSTQVKGKYKTDNHVNFTTAFPKAKIQQPKAVREGSTPLKDNEKHI